MANIITGIRIICSIALLFFPAFYTLYIVAGISDMIDGAVASGQQKPAGYMGTDTDQPEFMNELIEAFIEKKTEENYFEISFE